MASAREILDERLAKGEISVIEHTELVARIGGTPAASTAPIAAASQAETKKGKPLLGLLAFGLAIGACFVVANNTRAADVASTRAQCLSNGISSARCDCILIQFERNLPVVWYLPIVGRYLMPSDAEGAALMERAASVCL